MTLAQQIGDLESGGPSALFVDGLHADETEVDPVGRVAAAEAAHHGGQGQIGRLVLVGAEDCSLGLQDANHLEGLIADPELAADGLTGGQQFVAQIRADHRDHAGAGDVVGVDETALGHLKTSHRQKFGCHAGDGGGGTQRTGLNHLAEGDLGGHLAHTRDLFRNRLGVFQHQGFGGINALASGVIAAWHHKEHVGSQGAELAFRQILGPSTDPHHGDDGGIADHNAQHCEQAAQPIGLQRGQGHADGFLQGQTAGHGS